MLRVPDDDGAPADGVTAATRRRARPLPPAFDGYLWRREDGKAFLIPPTTGFHPTGEDPVVDPALLSRWHLESGLRVGASRPAATAISDRPSSRSTRSRG